jgi:hypothetical protein
MNNKDYYLLIILMLVLCISCNKKKFSHAPNDFNFIFEEQNGTVNTKKSSYCRSYYAGVKRIPISFSKEQKDSIYNLLLESGVFNNINENDIKSMFDRDICPSSVCILEIWANGKYYEIMWSSYQTHTKLAKKLWQIKEMIDNALLTNKTFRELPPSDIIGS